MFVTQLSQIDMQTLHAASTATESFFMETSFLVSTVLFAIKVIAREYRDTKIALKNEEKEVARELQGGN